MSRAVPARPGEFGLVERGRELAEITARLDAAFAGLGGALVVEGPRGIGVSALLHATIEIGRARGAQVARADPRSDERDVPLALVRRVLRALAVEVPADVARSGRRAIFDACERRPMLVVIDDAHAADRPSLALLADVAARLRGTRALVVAGWHVTGGRTASGAATMSGAGAAVIHPRPLSGVGIGELLARATGTTLDAKTTAAVLEATGGIPAYVAGLAAEMMLSGIHAAAREPAAVAQLVHVVVARDVRGRIADEDVIELAEALALLGAVARPERIAALLERPLGTVRAQLDRLVERGVLATADPPLFARPADREAIARSITLVGAQRIRADAARVLAAEGESLAAGELLLDVDPTNDPARCSVLMAAAVDALVAERPDVAIRLLNRLLAEPAVGLDVQIADMSTWDAKLVPTRAAAIVRLRRSQTAIARSAILAAAAFDALATTRPVDELGELCRRALANGSLADSPRGAPTALSLSLMLGYADCADLGIDHIDHVLGRLRANDVPALVRPATAFRGAMKLMLGRLEDAETDLRAVVGAPWLVRSTPLMTSFLLLCLLERDDDEGAAAVLARLDHEGGALQDLIPHAPFLYARGAVRGVRGDPHAALEDHLECGRRLVGAGWTNPVVSGWRGAAARILAEFGDHVRARELADDEVALAERYGAPGPLARALRARAAIAAAPDLAVAALDRALVVVEPAAAHAPLEHIAVLVDLAAAALAAEDPDRARRRLHAALTRARELGADAQTRRVTELLHLAGGRARRAHGDGLGISHRLSGASRSSRPRVSRTRRSARGLSSHRRPSSRICAPSSTSSRSARACSCRRRCGRATRPRRLVRMLGVRDRGRRQAGRAARPRVTASGIEADDRHEPGHVLLVLRPLLDDIEGAVVGPAGAAAAASAPAGSRARAAALAAVLAAASSAASAASVVGVLTAALLVGGGDATLAALPGLPALPAFPVLGLQSASSAVAASGARALAAATTAATADEEDRAAGLVEYGACPAAAGALGRGGSAVAPAGAALHPAFAAVTAAGVIRDDDPQNLTFDDPYGRLER